MNRQRRVRFGIRFVPLVLLVSALLLPLFVTSVHAAGSLYANPPRITALPMGHSFSVGIKILNFDSFNDWDIQVSANDSVIDPQSISLITSTLSANASGPQQIITVVQCVNGAGLACQPNDGPGIVHSAVAATSAVGGSGLLFTITYKVVGIGASDIHIFNDLLGNPDGYSISHTKGDAIYGTKPSTPSFSLSIEQSTLNVTQGNNLNATLKLASLNGFSGTVILTLNTSISGIQALLQPDSVVLASGGSAVTVLTIRTDSSTPATYFHFTVTGKSGLKAEYLTLDVSVLLPGDFLIAANPSLLLIHSAGSGETAIIAKSLRSFSGTIQVTAKTDGGPTVSLDSDTLNLESGGSAFTTLRVQIPPSNLTFRYTVTLTATNGKLSHSIDIFVNPPAPDFSFSVSAPSMSLEPGSSGQLSVTVTSQDYFEGIVYLSATSFSGTRLILSPATIHICIVHLLACPSRTESGSSNFTLSLDPSIAPGVHFVILTALGGSATHSLNVTLTVPQTSTGTSNGPVGPRTILGLQPSIYFGIIAALGVALAVAAIREVRKPNPSSGRTFLEDSPVSHKTAQG